MNSTAQTFTFHELLNKSGIKKLSIRTDLGVELSTAYKAVNGKVAPKLRINKWLKVRVYPIEFLPIAENTIKSHFERQKK